MLMDVGQFWMVPCQNASRVRVKYCVWLQKIAFKIEIVYYFISTYYYNGAKRSDPFIMLYMDVLSAYMCHVCMLIMRQTSKAASRQKLLHFKMSKVYSIN